MKETKKPGYDDTERRCSVMQVCGPSALTFLTRRAARYG